MCGVATAGIPMLIGTHDGVLRAYSFRRRDDGARH